METVSVIRQSRMKTKISMDMNEHKNVEIEKKIHTQTTRGATEWQLGMVLVHGANKYMHVAWQKKNVRISIKRSAYTFIVETIIASLQFYGRFPVAER